MADYWFNALLAAATSVEVPIDGQTGVWTKSGGVTISSGMKMIGATVTTGQIQYVYDRGVASNYTLAGGRIEVSSGGVASNGVVSAGSAIIAIGGMGVGMTAVGGRVFLNGYTGGATKSILSSSVVSGAFIQVAYDGKVENCNITGSTSISLLGSATIFSTTYINGGLFDNQPSGFLSGYSGVYTSDTSLTIDVRGGKVVDCTFARGTITYRPGVANPGSGITMLSAGSLIISPNNRVSGIVLSSGALVTVSSGGTAIGVTVASGGTATLSGGVLISGDVIGSALVSGGGVFSSSWVHGSTTVYSGGTAQYVSVGGGISGVKNPLLIISQGATVENLYVLSVANAPRGSAWVYNAASNVVADGGYVQVRSGGIVVGLTATSAGAVGTFSGAAIVNLTLDSTAGNTIIEAGAVLSGATIGAACFVRGNATDLTVVGSTLHVSNGGIASAVTVSDGGRMVVSSGGTALAVTSNAGAVVIVNDGGYIEYTN